MWSNGRGTFCEAENRNNASRPRPARNRLWLLDGVRVTPGTRGTMPADATPQDRVQQRRNLCPTLKSIDSRPRTGSRLHLLLRQP